MRYSDLTTKNAVCQSGFSCSDVVNDARKNPILSYGDKADVILKPQPFTSFGRSGVINIRIDNRVACRCGLFASCRLVGTKGFLNKETLSDEVVTSLFWNVLSKKLIFADPSSGFLQTPQPNTRDCHRNAVGFAYFKSLIK